MQKAYKYIKKIYKGHPYVGDVIQHIAIQVNIKDKVKGHFNDLLACKLRVATLAAFKFDPVKFSGNLASRAKHC
jgi:hypothetical protein